MSRFRLERELAAHAALGHDVRRLREVAELQARQLRDLRRALLKARMVRVAEVLEPLTLLVRFAPWQRQRPMNELLSGSASNLELDPTGSLIDADMGAYYQWINQQRLPGSERSSFLVWFEGHSQALAIGPSLPHGTESNSALDLGQLLSLAAG